MLRKVVICLSFSFLLLSIGCGSVSSSPSPTPTPTPIASPTPTPSPTPSAASDSLLTTMFLSAGRTPSPLGSVTADSAANNGSGNIQLTAIGVANTTLILQFCPYPQGASACFNVTSLTSDANANINGAFTFPQKGTFSGIFQLVQTNTAEFGVTGTGSTGTNFHSALLPAATVTGGIQQTTGHAPGSGTVVVTGTTAHITLAGTTANHTFNTAVCLAQCTALANVTTDAQGNASLDVGTVAAGGSSTFRISDPDGVQFVTAFRVQ